MSPICFQCGRAVSDGSRLNWLDDGRPCPACTARLLEALPPLLPGYSGEEDDVPAGGPPGEIAPPDIEPA